MASWSPRPAVSSTADRLPACPPRGQVGLSQHDRRRGPAACATLTAAVRSPAAIASSSVGHGFGIASRDLNTASRRPSRRTRRIARSQRSRRSEPSFASIERRKPLLTPHLRDVAAAGLPGLCACHRWSSQCGVAPLLASLDEDLTIGISAGRRPGCRRRKRIDDDERARVASRSRPVSTHGGIAGIVEIAAPCAELRQHRAQGGIVLGGGWSSQPPGRPRRRPDSAETAALQQRHPATRVPKASSDPA